jgi:hypothetical protein
MTVTVRASYAIPNFHVSHKAIAILERQLAPNGETGRAFAREDRIEH